MPPEEFMIFTQAASIYQRHAEHPYHDRLDMTGCEQSLSERACLWQIYPDRSAVPDRSA